MTFGSDQLQYLIGRTSRIGIVTCGSMGTTNRRRQPLVHGGFGFSSWVRFGLVSGVVWCMGCVGLFILFGLRS